MVVVEVSRRRATFHQQGQNILLQERKMDDTMQRNNAREYHLT